MNSTLKTILVLAGLYFAYQGYIDANPPIPTPIPDPTPVPIPDPSPVPIPSEITLRVITAPPEDFPGAPTSTELYTASEPLVALLKGSPEDSIKLARAFKAWADWLAQSPSIGNTDQFQELYIKSTVLLLKNHSIEGKYSGQIDKAVDASLRVFPALRISGQPWTPERVGEAQQAFNALSHQCFRAYLEGVKNQLEIPL